MKPISKEIEFIKDILDEHKADIESIKRKLHYLTNKSEEINEKIDNQKKQATEQTKTLEDNSKNEKLATEVDSLRNQLTLISTSISELKQAIGNNRNFQFPLPTSNLQNQNPNLQSPQQPQQQPKHDFVMDLERLQLLFILKQSKATTPAFAVSARQIKEAFSIDKTTRTLRNKLATLVREGYVIKISKKPALYFLSQNGLIVINKQEKSVFSFVPQEY